MTQNYLWVKLTLKVFTVLYFIGLALNFKKLFFYNLQSLGSLVDCYQVPYRVGSVQDQSGMILFRTERIHDNL